jgi:hypothetical protein
VSGLGLGDEQVPCPDRFGDVCLELEVWFRIDADVHGLDGRRHVCLELELRFRIDADVHGLGGRGLVVGLGLRALLDLGLDVLRRVGPEVDRLLELEGSGRLRRCRERHAHVDRLGLLGCGLVLDHPVGLHGLERRVAVRRGLDQRRLGRCFHRVLDVRVLGLIRLGHGRILRERPVRQVVCSDRPRGERNDVALYPIRRLLVHLAETGHLLREGTGELELADHAQADERLAQPLPGLPLPLERVVELLLGDESAGDEDLAQWPPAVARRAVRAAAAPHVLPLLGDDTCELLARHAESLDEDLAELLARLALDLERHADLALGDEAAVDEQRPDQSRRDGVRCVHPTSIGNPSFELER